MNARFPKYCIFFILPFYLFESYALAASTATKNCYPKDTNPSLIRSHYQRTRDNGTFFKNLVKKLGEPQTCSGEITGKGDEVEKVFRFLWKDGQKLTVTTEPPELSIVVLENLKGFASDVDIIAMAKDHVKALGWNVEWAKVDKTEPLVDEYSDKDSGLNALLKFKYDKNKKLISVTISINP